MLVLLAAFGSAATVAAEPVDVPCLQRELHQSEPQTTVAELRRRCAPTDTGTPRTSLAIDRVMAAPAAERSLFERRVVSEVRAMQEPFALLPHRPTYIDPVSYQKRLADTVQASGANEPLETQFQISFKFPISRPLFDGRVMPFFAYTGRAWWQVYDGARSRPFREYNHEPELLLALPTPGFEAWGWRQRLVMLGFNHQSNGRSVPQSRSWNRLTAELLFDRGTAEWASLRLWHRLPEDAKTAPNDSRGDDNPDITRYLGHFEFKLGRVAAGGHNLTLAARRSLRPEGKGAVQIDWSHPVPHSPALRWHVRAFSGYGDSLIDYNHRVDRVGVGIMLKDWF
jgi:phospholipase A1/A2